MEKGPAALTGCSLAIKHVTAAPCLWSNQITEPRPAAWSERERARLSRAGVGVGAGEQAWRQHSAGHRLFNHSVNAGLLPVLFLNMVIIRYQALFGFLFISLE